MEGLGVTDLDKRALLSSLMPERNHFKELGRDSVVDEVANSPKVQPAYSLRPGSFYLGANAGLGDQ